MNIQIFRDYGFPKLYDHMHSKIYLLHNSTLFSFMMIQYNVSRSDLPNALKVRWSCRHFSLKKTLF
jgi:hypothetical protein